MKKKLVLLLLAAVMVTSTFTGCSSTGSNTVVAEVGKKNITADVANFYLRFTQAQYETYYKAYMGDNMWDTEVEDGKTYADNVKDSVIDDLELMYVLREHMDDYDVKLTDDDKDKIKEAAKSFASDNSDDVKDKVSGEKETVEEVLTLLTIQTKMREAIVKDADTNVTDDEAKQKSMDYVMFSYTSTDESGNQTDLSDDEKAQMKTMADEFLEGAKGAADFSAYATEQGYEPQTVTFDKDSTSPGVDLIAAADALGEGEYTSVIETDTGCFVAKVTSLFDKDATESKKQEIISGRQEDLFKEVTDKWVKDADVKVKKNAWKKLNVKDMEVTIYQEPSEDTGTGDQTTDGQTTDDQTTDEAVENSGE